MKAFLMHRDQDFDLEGELPPTEEDLEQDLELDKLFAAMALGDEFLFEVAGRGVMSSLHDPDAIVYRQEILRDCLEKPAVVREIYDLAVEAINRERKDYIHLGVFRDSPDLVLSRSLRVLEMFIEMLKRLREICDQHAGEFRSEGFVLLFRTLSTELDDAYFETLEEHVRQLRFPYGELVSAELGKGNKGTRYVLHQAEKPSWRERLPFRERSSYSFQLADRDESGARALKGLRDRGVNVVGNALAQSTDHVTSFFAMLRAELGFYIGCLNLHEQLVDKGEPTCFPVPLASGEPALSCQGLYDVCLSLNIGERTVGSDVAADGRSLVVITGANQGGKSTFLGSVGLAQLMMQCGMFVAAESFHADVRDGVFTHFKREEDPTMKSGKLDEELGRMSEIVDHIGPNSVLLCNESFASTNEREGSEIARQIVRALLERGIKVLFVTHMFDLAQGLYSQGSDEALFLRAERKPDGRRTFRMVEGEPLPTSFGEDLYRRIFGARPDATRALQEAPRPERHAVRA